MRRAVGLVGGLILLFACVAVLAIVLYPIDRIRPDLESRLSAGLGIPVKLGRLSASILGGIGVRVDGIQVGPAAGSPAGEGLTLDAEHARVRLALAPLFRRKVVFRGIDVWEAEIRQRDRPIWRDARLRAAFERSGEGYLTVSGSIDGRLAAVASLPPASATFEADLVEDQLQLRRVTARFGGGSLTARGVVHAFSSASPRIDLELAGVIGATHVSGSVSAAYGRRRSEIRFDLTSPEVRSADFAPLAAILSTSRAVVSKGPAAASSDASGSLRITGRIGADHATIGALQLDALRADLKFEEGRADLENIHLALYGGEQSGRLSVNMSSPQLPFQLTSRLDGIDMKQLADALASGGGRLLEGTGRLEVDLAGCAPAAQVDRGSLRGTVRLEIRDGRMVNIGILAQVATLAARIDSKNTDRGDTPFRLLSARFQVEGGQARAESVTLESDEVDVAGTGVVGLDGSIDLDLIASLAPSITAALQEKAPALRHWVGPDHRLVVPLRLAGTVREPRIRMDVNRAASDALARFLDSKERRGVLRRILGGR